MPGIEPPFKEATARMVAERLGERFAHVPAIGDKRIRDAVKSLGAASLEETGILYRLQGKFCTRCGNCCRIVPSIVFEKADLRAIARRLGETYKKLKKRIRAQHAGRAGFWFVPGRPCPFLAGLNECTVYDLRPKICRAYPMGKTLQERLRREKSTLIPPEDCPAMVGLLTELAAVRLVEEEAIRRGISLADLGRYIARMPMSPGPGAER